MGVASWTLPCRDAALHRREDRKRKRDEEKAADKEKEKLKKIKEDTQKEAEGVAKEEPAAQQNGTRGDEAKEDAPGKAQIVTEHIKEEPASDAGVFSDKVRHCCVADTVRLTSTFRSRD